MGDGTGRGTPPVGPAPVRAGAGSFRTLAVLAALLGTGWALAAGDAPAGSAPLAVYPDSPPAGFAGGFGEGTCHSCHFEAEPNQGPGSVRLLGLPEAYAPGERYEITVELTRPGLVLGGFELTARHVEGGAQAGELAAPPGEEARIGVTVSRDIAYAHHRLEGTEPVAPDTARWTVLWTAPAAPAGAVAIHVAANAADGDETVYGDLIFTAEATVEAPR